MIYYRYSSENELLGLSNVVVPFVACGDLSGFNSDKSYPLQLTSIPSNMTSMMRFSGNNEQSYHNTQNQEDSQYIYTYRQPIQPPIKPNYYAYQTQLQQHQSQQQQNKQKTTLDI